MNTEELDEAVSVIKKSDSFLLTCHVSPDADALGSVLAMGLALKIFLIPYRTMLWNSGRKDDSQFIILREIPSFVGKIILFLLAIKVHNNIHILFLII